MRLIPKRQHDRDATNGRKKCRTLNVPQGESNFRVSDEIFAGERRDWLGDFFRVSRSTSLGRKKMSRWQQTGQNIEHCLVQWHMTPSQPTARLCRHISMVSQGMNILQSRTVCRRCGCVLFWLLLLSGLLSHQSHWGFVGERFCEKSVCSQPPPSLPRFLLFSLSLRLCTVNTKTN